MTNPNSLRRVQSFRPVRAIIDLAVDWLERFVAVQGIDRAMAIGAQAYTALIPLLIVYASILPREGRRNFADVLVERFELTGATAASVQRAFAPAGEVQSSVTALGVVFLIVSAMSFTRGLQRLYEGAYGLDKLGVRNSVRGAEWLLAVVVFATLRPLVLAPFGGWLLVAATVGMGVVLWLLTPYLLLGGRVPWRNLLPSAVLTAIGMIGVGVWSVIWMPHTLATSAAQFGVIGIGFAMLTWLVAVSSVVVVATTGGAMIAARIARRRGDA